MSKRAGIADKGAALAFVLVLVGLVAYGLPSSLDGLTPIRETRSGLGNAPYAIAVAQAALDARYPGHAAVQSSAALDANAERVTVTFSLVDGTTRSFELACDPACVHGQCGAPCTLAD